MASKALQQINSVKDIGENLFFAISFALPSLSLSLSLLLKNKIVERDREMSYFCKTERSVETTV